MAKATAEHAYQVKVVLDGVKPPVWRRLLVPSSMPLEALHRVLQAAMGWTDSHLHRFEAGVHTYGAPDLDFEDDTIDEGRVRLDQVLVREKDVMVYEYDFGDAWAHKIVLEGISEIEKDARIPRCLDGARACPPEDCGGAPGYAEFLAVLRDPSHPEHRERLEWIGGSFDPEQFDLVEVNRALASRRRRT